MESFVSGPMTWPPLRVLSRNPLVRASDRIEAAAITLAVLMVIVAAAWAGALGTMVHDSSAHRYAQEARTRHPVLATAMADSAPSLVSPSLDHTAELPSDNSAKANDPLPIWVDDHGDRVPPPSPASRAVTDAVSVAVVTWMTAVLAVAVAWGFIRVRVARMRDAQWGRDIRCLVGGRTNGSH